MMKVNLDKVWLKDFTNDSIWLIWMNDMEAAQRRGAYPEESLARRYGRAHILSFVQQLLQVVEKELAHVDRRILSYTGKTAKTAEKKSYWAGRSAALSHFASVLVEVAERMGNPPGIAVKKGKASKTP